MVCDDIECMHVCGVDEEQTGVEACDDSNCLPRQVYHHFSCDRTQDHGAHRDLCTRNWEDHAATINPEEFQTNETVLESPFVVYRVTQRGLCQEAMLQTTLSKRRRKNAF